MNNTQALLVLVGSPRRSGNSATLGAAVQRGAEQAGARMALRFIDDSISSFLRDCRTSRRAGGECAIDERSRSGL
jgi:multimeric flavodoxin WrbA